MENSLLYNLIQSIEYGTNLHIGVLFFKDYGNSMCELPRHQKIHQSPICDFFKTQSRNSFFRCVRCRNLALHKALTTKKSFGGLCVNGIYEYTHPIVIDGEVACVIFIGNILDQNGILKMEKNSNGQNLALDTLEPNFSPQKAKRTAEILEEYIRFLLEKHPNNNGENLLINNIKAYIEANLGFKITIETLANLFHYNPRYLGRLFKKETGTTVNEYVTYRRLKLAKRLLLKTENPIIDISCETGFSTVTYFNRLFKLQFGVTPTEYRKTKAP